MQLRETHLKVFLILRLGLAWIAQASGQQLARTGRMLEPLSGRTATLLADGRVLFAGGAGTDRVANPRTFSRERL